jgi:hypothetical protein
LQIFSVNSDIVETAEEVQERNEREVFEVEHEQQLDNNEVVMAEVEEDFERNYLEPSALF